MQPPIFGCRKRYDPHPICTNPTPLIIDRSLNTPHQRHYSSYLLGPDYMSRAGPVSRAASVCRDDFLPGITWGKPARLMADAMNHGRPERAWFWCDEGLISRAGPANAITWKNLSPVSRDPGTAIPGSRLTGLAQLSCNRREVDFYGVWQTCSRSRQTDTSPATSRLHDNRASPVSRDPA